MSYSKRIEKLFAASRERAKKEQHDTFIKDVHYAANNLYTDLEKWERIARSMAWAIENQQVYVDADDRIVGRTYYGPDFRSNIATYPGACDIFDWRTRPEARIAREVEDYTVMQSFALTAGVAAGHIAWDYALMLREGTTGIRARIEAASKRNTDEKSQQFYRGALIMIEALENWNRKHVDALIELGMTDMAALLSRVPEQPCTTFHEAVQAYYMQHIVIMKENPFGGNSPGRLDYYLWPYLEADLAAGRCTMDEARDLIYELFIKIDERLYARDNWGETIVVGGTRPDGSSAVNPLTYIMIEAIMDMDLIHPLVYVRVPEKAPEELLSVCAKYLLHGNNRAQIVADKNIISALTSHGVPYEEAVDYFCGGCMEIAIQGKTADCLYNGWHNMPKMVELAVTGGVSLNDGRVTDRFRVKGIENYDNFEDFYADFIKEARRIITMAFKALDIYGEEAAESRPSYLISTMLDDCIERGRNMHGGGTKYYDYGTTPIGLPNATDYLYAVKRAVYEDKICTAGELITALKANFEGYELLRRRLAALPKYGQGDADADAFAKRLFTDISDIYDSYTNRCGGHGKMIILTFVFAPDAGRMMGATADGNFAGRIIAQGVTPQGSSMKNGITAAINSATCMPCEIYSGGASTMWDLDPTWANEDIVRALLATFIERGGQIFQGNMTSVDDLLRAKEHPEEYAHLMVRVGGYSARFVNLGEALQRDIIERYRHRG